MHQIKRIINKLKKLIIFIPVIWSDEDWDSFYMLRIIITKLICMKKYFLNSHIVVEEQEKEILDGINRTLQHLDDYLECGKGNCGIKPPFETIHTTIPSPDMDGCSQLVTLKKDTREPLTPNEEKEYREYLISLLNKEQECWDAIWDTIKAEGQKWWD